MKLFPCSSILLLCVLSHHISFSQSKDFTPGYYISLQGDTIHGHLNLKKGTPNDLKFKTDLNNKDHVIIRNADWKAVASHGRYYVKWFGARKMTYVDKIDFRIHNLDSNTLTATIPLELIYRGSRLSLYYFADATDHFFVEHNGNFQELTREYRYSTEYEKSRYVVNPPTYFMTPVYKSEIVGLLNGKLTARQYSLLEVTEYEKKSFIRLFKSLNKS
jgi:hypothetical protein